MDRERIAPRQLLGSILDGALLLIGEAGRAQITVQATKPQRRRVLAGDRVRLEQVLINLLRNALDAVDDRPDPRVAIVAPVARPAATAASNESAM